VQEDSNGDPSDVTLRDLLSTYQKELDITNKVVEQAEVEVPESGYDTSKFYIVPAGPDGTPLEPKGHNTDETTTDSDSTTIDASSTRITPENTTTYSGYLVGDGLAPNGESIAMATSFPAGSVEGEYVLRLDFMPNRLFRFNGSRWVKIEDDVRSKITPGTGTTQRDGFINNSNTTTQDNDTIIDQRQALSKVLEIKEDE
jgi:hypothetical protein